MSLVRFALIGAAAALLLIALAPLRLLAQARGWRIGRWTPQVFHRLACAALGVEVKVHGEPAAGGRLVVSNHLSWLDIPVLGSIAPMTFLAKKEIGASALGGRLAGLQGLILVDRGRRRAIPAVNAEMARVIGEGEPVVLFAEATTGDGNRLLPFRSSHFEAAREAARRGETFVQPVYLDYSRLAGLAIGRRGRPTVAWYGDTAFLPHFRGLLAAGRTRCDVYFGAPIPVQAAESRKALCRRTESALRAIAGAARAANWPILARPGSA
jgi:1-acyl-sn-glycerol-3-phosphate acyltransferase